MMHRHVSVMSSVPQEDNLHQCLQRHMRRLIHLLFLFFLFSLTSNDNGVAAQSREGRTYPLLATIPKTTFSCRGHTTGYYADPETGCQVYHMCDTLAKQYSYLCPNHTLFNQKFMVCDHWYMVNCSSATTFYDLNNHIGEVPNSSEQDDSQTNTIKDSSTRRPTTVNQEDLGKEVKSTAPVAITFKASGVTPPKPPLSTTSRVTPRTTSKSSNRPQPFISQSVSTTRTTSLLTASVTTPIPLIVSNSRSESRVRTNLKSVETPSRLLDLPSVESAFANLPSAARSVPPPSVFFQLPDKVFRTSSETSKEKLEGTRPSSNQEKLINEVDIPFVQTPRPGSSFSMMPGVVARNPGGKFTFTSGRGDKPTFLPVEFQDVLFRPLIIRPKIKLRKIFTSAPAAITTEPHHADEISSSDQATQHSTPTVFAAPLTNNSISTSRRPGSPFSNRNGVEIPSIVLRPPPLVPVSLNIPPFLPPLQQTLTPPNEGKQEFIVTPVRFRSTSLLQPLHVATTTFTGLGHFHLPASRSNRDFFIPSPGLTLPDKELPELLKNSLDDHQSTHLHEEHGKSNMTMVFPAPIDNAKMAALKKNPNCPKCHPAFLRAGQCTPCVLIR